MCVHFNRNTSFHSSKNKIPQYHVPILLNHSTGNQSQDNFDKCGDMMTKNSVSSFFSTDEFFWELMLLRGVSAREWEGSFTFYRAKINPNTAFLRRTWLALREKRYATFTLVCQQYLELKP